MIGRLEQQICYEGIQHMCFECGRLGHRKEHCPHVVQQGPSNSEDGLKEATETCSSSHVAHVTDEPRCEKGTNGALCDSEQSTEQVEVREGVYGPWIVVARRKSGTKLLRSGGTSLKQSSVFSFKDNGYVEKESLVLADAYHGPSREVKRKLSSPKFIERDQIVSVVQSLRRDGQKQAQRSPKMMLKSVDAKPNVT
nr:hypothetical protein CFP56_53196 [Quercus suber]